MAAGHGNDSENQRAHIASDTLLLYALEIAVRDEKVSADEIKVCMSGDIPLPPEYEAIARRQLSIEEVENIVRKALVNNPDNTPSIENLIERLRKQKK